MSIYEAILSESQAKNIQQKRSYAARREETRKLIYGDAVSTDAPRRDWASQHEFIKARLKEGWGTSRIRDALMAKGFKCAAKDVCAYIRNHNLRDGL